MVRTRERRLLSVIVVVAAACLWGRSVIGRAALPAIHVQTDPAARPAVDSAAADVALILQRLKADFADPNSTYPHDVHGANIERAQDAKDSLSRLAADGHWPDLEFASRRPANSGAYGDPTTPNFHSNAYLVRLGQMTVAYANSNSPDYHSRAMLEGIEHALAYWYKNHSASENWWDNTVGEPQLLARILVPLADVLPADLLQEGLTHFVVPAVKDPSYSRAAVSYPQQQLVRGVLTGSAEDVAAASEEMQRIIRVRTDEGFQRDWSFHQHGPQLYNGGYGLTVMVDLCNYAMVLRGTRFAFAHDKLMFLADHVLEGDGHMIRGEALDYSAFGRTLLRRNAGQSAVELEAVCDQLATLLPERAAELSALKKHIEGSGAPDSYSGNTYFWNSDFMTHQRDAYYISVKMVSYRTVGTETIHAENMKGCWLPFGATWILRRGDEYNSILPVLDWGRVPGVTSPHVTLPPLRNVSQPEGFVGGVSDGTYGAAAMVFDQNEPTPLVPVFKIMTQGRKAWFFFDREMVALGAGIRSVRDEPVGTTLNQTGLHGPVLIDGHAAGQGETSVAPGSWVLHDEVGYALLGQTAAHLNLGTQTGDVRPMRTGNPGPPPTAQVFTLWIDHGVHPRDAEYAYAILPGTDAQQLAAWSANPEIRVIANTPVQQAVINNQLGVAQMVFYKSGSATLTPGLTVKVDHPCLAMLVRQGKSTRVAVSSPGGEFFSMHLTLVTGRKEKVLNFEMPSGDSAGKSVVMEAPVRW